ncbi:MAG TPA: hypothetical protein VNK73_11270 [Actinomycetota bacterium]|nr:hypothetical protein [Actinomycetota bacterium]
MARKDREAARRRHAIDRARREAGDEPTPKPKPTPGTPSSKAKTNGGRASGGRGSAAPLRKLQVGDVDRRGRVFTRNMVLHPRVALRIYVVVLAVAVVSLFRRELVGASYGAFAVGMLVIADTQATWKRAIPYLILAGLLAVAAIVVTVAGLTGRV